MGHDYPVMLNLSGHPCLVVGGGKVAERKTAALLDAGASVTLVSPSFTDRIEEWAANGKVTGKRKAYDPADGIGMLLVFAATDDPEVNMRVCRDARTRNQWVNVADRPESSDFIVPSVMRRGKLHIAVSTSGASPSLSGRICRELEQQYGEEYETAVEFLGVMRSYIKERIENPGVRERMLKRLGQTDWIPLIRSNAFDPSPELWMERLKQEIRDESSQEQE